MEYPMLAQAWLLGGHVRVGMEDNVYIEKGVLAERQRRARHQSGPHHRRARRHHRHRRRKPERSWRFHRCHVTPVRRRHHRSLLSHLVRGRFFERFNPRQARHRCVSRAGKRLRVTWTPPRQTRRSPIHGALVEFWQANAEGRYRTPDNTDDPEPRPELPRLRTRCALPARAFAYRTIKPGRAGSTESPHISLTIFCDGISRVTTPDLFRGRGQRQRIRCCRACPRSERGEARSRAGSRPHEYAIDIVMSGDGRNALFRRYGTAPAASYVPARPTWPRKRACPKTSSTTIPAKGSSIRSSPAIPRHPGLRDGENDMSRIAPGRPRAEGRRRRRSRQGHRRERQHRSQGILLELWNANPHGRYTHIDDPAEQPLDPSFLRVRARC